MDKEVYCPVKGGGTDHRAIVSLGCVTIMLNSHRPIDDEVMACLHGMCGALTGVDALNTWDGLHKGMVEITDKYLRPQKRKPHEG